MHGIRNLTCMTKTESISITYGVMICSIISSGQEIGMNATIQSFRCSTDYRYQLSMQNKKFL
nr:hypothetical protein Itr_chr05CG19090 [Ipomoea trifida]